MKQRRRRLRSLPARRTGASGQTPRASQAKIDVAARRNSSFQQSLPASGYETSKAVTARAHRPRTGEREGCQNHVHSCNGSVVLVHKAAETIATLDIADGRRELWRLGRLEGESAVGAFAVVVLDVDAQ